MELTLQKLQSHQKQPVYLMQSQSSCMTLSKNSYKNECVKKVLRQFVTVISFLLWLKLSESYELLSIH